MSKTIFTFIAIAFFSIDAAAQERDLIELLRKDMQTEKATIITEVMKFTNEESAVFWPIYREYEKELATIMDKRLALIGDYAKNYEAMTGEKATELVNTAFDLEIERANLVKQYFKKFSKVLTPVRAARFTQVENQILKLVDVQIAQELPLAY